MSGRQNSLKRSGSTLLPNLGIYILYSLDRIEGVIYHKDMSRSTMSTHKLFAMFPDQETARVYLESRPWPNGPTCPTCSGAERITTRKDGFYRCNRCKLDFTVRTATIFERSHVKLHKWVHAMYLLVTARKDISSMQLAKEIGVTQKTAWFMLQRLREACGNDPTILEGIVEVDEAHFGGKESNRHQSKRKRVGTGAAGKTTVVGMRERGGRTKGIVLSEATTQNIQGAVVPNVLPGSEIQTDESGVYVGLEGIYYRDTITHARGEYARPGVTTNGIESVWAVLKRGLHSVYHHASPKHLHRYVDEFTFRLNDGNVRRHTLERLDSFITATSGCRLIYARLTA